MIIPVDKIYVLHLCECPERLSHFNEEYDKMEIENPFEIWWACKHPHTYEIAHYLRSENKFQWNCYGNGNAYNCAREHYSIIKQAYYRGFSTIAIFEDDWTWKDGKEKIQNFFNQKIKENWDIITFGYYYNPSYTNNNDIYDVDEIKINKITEVTNDCWGTPFYMLNRNGMKYYLNYMDNTFATADYPLAVAPRYKYINYYKSNISLFKYVEEIKSEIQNG